MISFVYGGSGSGKSEYAENLALTLADPEHRYYLATMQVYGEEGIKRVQRHQKLRAGKGFATIECPVKIQSAIPLIEEPEKSVVLLECVSNLVANELFDTKEKEQDLEDRILKGFTKLSETVRHLVVVSVNVFEDGTDYEETTVRYMKALGDVNRRIAQLADQVTEVVVSIPVKIK